MRRLAIILLAAGILLGVLSVVQSSPGVMIDRDHAALQAENAVQTEKIASLAARVESIESRLFSIFLAAGGALCSSVATVVISLLTHRRLGRDGEGG